MSRIRNGYLHFRGKIKRRKAKEKKRHNKKELKRRSIFWSYASKCYGPVAANLLNGIVWKIF